MKYTKWITVLLCLLGLAACRQDAPRFRIGVAQCSDDSWRHKMNDEILREAMFYDGVMGAASLAEIISKSTPLSIK